MQTLLEIRDYLKAAGVEAPLYAPLVRVIAGLHDLDQGVQPPLFDIANKRRNALSSARKMLHGSASAGVTLLMEAGYALEEACKQVAQELEDREVRVAVNQHASKQSWKTIHGWRANVLKAKQGKRAWETRQHYKKILETAHAKLEETMVSQGLTTIPDDWYKWAATVALSELVDKVDR